MDLISGAQILLRRWYVTVPGLVLAGVLVFATWTTVSPTYQAIGSLLLHNPPTGQDPTTGRSNPYTNYNNLQIPARVVVDVLNQPTKRAELADEGATGTFELLLDPTGSVPVVTVVSTGGTEQETVRTLELAMNGYDEVLLERQQMLGAPRSTLVTTEVVTAPTRALALQGSRIRAALITGVMAVALTIGLAFAAEGVARRFGPARSPAPTGAGGGVTGPVTCPFCSGAIWPDAMVAHLESSHGLQGSSSAEVRRLTSRAGSAGTEPSTTEPRHETPGGRGRSRMRT